MRKIMNLDKINIFREQSKLIAAAAITVFDGFQHKADVFPK